MYSKLKGSQYNQGKIIVHLLWEIHLLLLVANLKMGHLQTKCLILIYNSMTGPTYTQRDRPLNLSTIQNVLLSQI